ncbi:cache domain-containing protein [Pelagovum pacificum]|uniref:Uncharacterized protein n=1 Tax=Pelagovum pacificum TaxID=2588711 RepID=A0A5C5GDH9_9RHOB|nr:cache domain-containing protein [Pelagovum pacificum]QQA44016.1 cache domain-containing protein [Pelagovum pacificum]TNY32855.1 hypothetical protein FHY64_06145 [Pelagovum pacificum]
MEKNFPKLSITLINFSVVAFVAALAIVFLPVRNYVSEHEYQSQTLVAERAGQALQVAVSRAVEREWRSMSAVARQLDIEDQEGMRNFADTVIRASDAVAWVGVASDDGLIIAGTGGEREGEDVSLRRWFREGLTGGSVGNTFLPDQSDVPGSNSGLVNMSVPVVDDFGNSVGVVVYSLKIAWLTSYMAETADELDVDFMVKSDDGVIVAEYNPILDVEIDRDVSSLSSLGHPITRVLTERNGPPAVVSVIPDLLTAEGMPHFNWNLVVRVPALNGGTSLTGFMSTMAVSIAGIFFAMTMLSVFYALHYLRPIERLAREANAIAEGEEIYPSNDHSSLESARLSKALAILQTRVQALRTFPGE